MADQKKVTAGKTFLQQVLAKIPEAKRAAAIAILEDPEAADALELAGGGALMQSEFSRGMTEVQAGHGKNKEWRDSLDKWWNDKQKEIMQLQVDLALAREGKTPAGGGNPDPDPDPAPIRTAAVDLTGYVKKEDVDKQIGTAVAQASQQVVPLITVLTTLGLKHMKEFGEVLDVDGLIKHSRETETPIDKGAYESFVKDKIDEKAKKVHDDEIAAARKAGADEARQAIQTTPYPVSPNEPTTLSGMTRKKDAAPDPQFGVAAAVAEFNRLVTGA